MFLVSSVNNISLSVFSEVVCEPCRWIDLLDRNAVSLSVYLIDSVSAVCSSKRLSHACKKFNFVKLRTAH